MKTIHIYEEHHHVVKAWSLYQKSNVITFDYHTDTHVAFCRYAFNYESNVHDWSIADNMFERYADGSILLTDCVRALRNDEHIDFAIKAGVAGTVFVVNSKGSCGDTLDKRIFSPRSKNGFNNQSIIIFPIDQNYELSELMRAEKIIADEIIDPSIQYIGNLYSKFFENFILDIDLDYFHSMKSFDNPCGAQFQWLAKNAKAITIATEPECVDECKLDDDDITAEKALEAVLNIIKKANKNIEFTVKDARD